MTEEIVKILKVGTDDAVKSVNDLKENVKTLKENLGKLDIGTEEYQNTLNLLKVNQNALKDAMYATSTSMKDLTDSATGTSETYNSLVHRMAALKESLRATDVSTEDGKKAFKDLAGQINDVNNRLKEMDALQGNFQRNVGNYQSAFKALSEHIDALDKGFKATNGGLGDIKGGFEALSASPAIGTFAIIVSVAVKLADALKDNETATAALKKAMNALKPVMDFIAGVVETLATWLAVVIEKVSEFVTSNGIFQELINGVMGVGNAVLQFVIAPFKGIVKAIGVLKEEGVKGLKNAAKAFGEEMKNGVSFKSNYQAGEAVADAIISGAKSKSQAVKDAGVSLGKDLGDSVSEGFKLADFDKALAAAEKKAEETRRQMLQEQKELDALVEDEWDRTSEEIEAYVNEEIQQQERAKKAAQEAAQQKIASLNAVATATSSIFGSIADIYESDEKNSEKNAKKIKALRIASATIDTISGAVGALTSAAANPGGIPGMIIGAANAAAITATGIAQIAKIKATKISGSSTSSGSIATGAVTSAPTLQTQVSNVRSVTSASEEERLNQIASSQRVYILASDIEASQNQIRTQVAESSF